MAAENNENIKKAIDEITNILRGNKAAEKSDVKQAKPNNAEVKKVVSDDAMLDKCIDSVTDSIIKALFGSLVPSTCKSEDGTAPKEKKEVVDNMSSTENRTVKDAEAASCKCCDGCDCDATDDDDVYPYGIVIGFDDFNIGNDNYEMPNYELEYDDDIDPVKTTLVLQNAMMDIMERHFIMPSVSRKFRANMMNAITEVLQETLASYIIGE